MWGLTRLALYLFQVSWVWLKAMRSGKWPRAEAVVTVDPAARYAALAGFTVEVPYTYRFQGELFTGLHEEPSFGGVGSRFLQRFAKGRRFLVRVNPAKPEVSIMRDRDQTDDIQERLERSDELQGRDVIARK
jgi:uncharacterized protein DUF3592